MTAPEKCDICDTRHHKHQAHVFAKVVPVEVAKSTLAYMRAGGTFQASVGVDAVVDEVLGVTVRCKSCGEVFRPRRSHAKTCSAKCRQAASRKRRA